MTILPLLFSAQGSDNETELPLFTVALPTQGIQLRLNPSRICLEQAAVDSSLLGCTVVLEYVKLTKPTVTPRLYFLLFPSFLLFSFLPSPFLPLPFLLLTQPLLTPSWGTLSSFPSFFSPSILPFFPFLLLSSFFSSFYLSLCLSHPFLLSVLPFLLKYEHFSVL